MSYRLVDSNNLALKYPEVNDMPCIYADLPNGLDGKHYTLETSRKGHWIPVSERLPERNKRVIVCYETMEGLKVDTSIFDKYGCLLGKAVAWMPLPEPYKDMRGAE